jgi:hypothetical protein
LNGSGEVHKKKRRDEGGGGASFVPSFLLVTSSLLLLAGCGYHALHGEGSVEKLRVELGTVSVADAIAADEVTAGARDALAKEGALGGGDGSAGKLVIEVTRIDETADAIAAPSGGAPVAHAVVVAVVGRGTVYSARDSRGALRDTGDMRATALVSPGADARGDAFVHDSAVRAAARRLGRKIALRAIGEPVSSEDGEGRSP